MENTASLSPRAPTFDHALRSGAAVQPAAWGAHRPAHHGPGLLSGGVSALLQAALDHLGFGVMVVGAPLSVVYANAVARRECARNPSLRIQGGQLSLPESRQLGDFMRAVAGARRGRWSLVQLGHGDERLALAVLPLQDQPDPDDAPALVVFGLRGRSRDLALEFYARSCGLTPTETRVLRALADGMNAHQIAELHRVKISTVRTQLTSIRQRTDTRSITELVRTLSGLPPIMPALRCSD